MRSDRDVAWAAGLFEAEGTVCGYVPAGRHARTVQVTVYQGAQAGRPDLLERFQRVTGCGSIVGPYRGRLYHWTTKRIASVETICELLWPNLSTERKSQFERAFGSSDRWQGFARGLERPVSGTERTSARELAWAAGFFDGEGSVMRATRGSPRLEVAQASAAGEAHSSIRRLHLALGGLGRVTGPRVLRNDWSRLPQYRWEATSFADVQAVIALLWPDLGPTKRAAARDALGLYLRRVRERRLPS